MTMPLWFVASVPFRSRSNVDWACRNTMTHPAGNTNERALRLASPSFVSPNDPITPTMRMTTPFAFPANMRYFCVVEKALVSWKFTPVMGKFSGHSANRFNDSLNPGTRPT